MISNPAPGPKNSPKIRIRDSENPDPEQHWSVETQSTEHEFVANSMQLANFSGSLFFRVRVCISV